MLIFSIIVPVYNVEKYLTECIESIIGQTYSGWELILVDDGSTDHSNQICRKYAEQNEKISLFCKSNSGQADSRNFGIEKAKGDYLVFVDSDDYIAVDALQRFYDEIYKWNMPDVVLSEGMYEVRGDIIKEYKHWNSEEYQGMTGRDALLKTMQYAPNWSPCDKCYHLDFWREQRFCFPTKRLAEDFALIDKVVLEAKRVSMIPSYYYYRRFRKDSTMSPRNKQLKYDELLNLVEWEHFLEERKQDVELINAFRKVFSELYCHDILGYLFLFHGKERKDVINIVKQLKFYLDYAEGKEERKVQLLARILGINCTCMLLGIIKRYRIQKERVKCLGNKDE